MQKCDGTEERSLKTVRLNADLCVVGGGLAGVCCAITAARAGIRVVLIGDRPVLGGNASSEVRLWVLGATSHMGNNNRWAREGGVMDEIYVENTYRNSEGNPLIFDLVLLDKVKQEPNITLLLNTAVHEVIKHAPDRITGVRGFCAQDSTLYEVHASLFCDASGDGIVGFLAGAAFRMGAESAAEFGEKFAPNEEYGKLLGHSIYFYSKDVGRPVQFTPPSFALQDIEQIPRYRRFNARDYGCHLWWLEYGGRLDTIHDTEQIKWELWRVVYGVWNYIKNSGKFPESESLTLEWVGQIPGKRESRRFEGDYILSQRDVIEQRTHEDAVSFGGWAIDLHPADGVFSEKPACNQWHMKGVYQIPYRSLYSRNIENLFLGGRVISASHVAFGSTRVMATCGHNGQAVGMAAAICSEQGLLPRDLLRSAELQALRYRLQQAGHFIPKIVERDPEDLAQSATLTASSQLRVNEFEPVGEPTTLADSWAMLVPLKCGQVPKFTFHVVGAPHTEIECELRTSSRHGNFTPDVLVAQRTVTIPQRQVFAAVTPHSRRRSAALVAHGNGNSSTARRSLHVDEPAPSVSGSLSSEIEVDFDTRLERDQYAFVCLRANERVAAYWSDERVSGITAVRHGTDRRVAEENSQTPPEDIGVEAFELWSPIRRPACRNLAMQIEPPLECFGPENVVNGIARPTERPNAWVADPTDAKPRLTLTWSQPQTIGKVELSFDTDFDHPMETVLMGHPESVMPFCVRKFRIVDDSGHELARCKDNYQTRRVISFEQPVTTSSITIEIEAPSPETPASLFEVRCYAKA